MKTFTISFSRLPIRVRMASGGTWVARIKRSGKHQVTKPITKSCTSTPERAARRAAAQALHCEPEDIILLVLKQPLWNSAGDYLAARDPKTIKTDDSED